MKPQMNTDERRSDRGMMPIDQLTEAVIGCAFAVSNALGAGFLEKVYENALMHELRKLGIDAKQQAPIHVKYDGVVVGDYVADLIVDDRLVVELKAAKAIDDVHVAQTINYLRASQRNIGLILNFGNPKLEIKRLVHRL